MLDDIRNSTLLTMVSAVVMAVAAIVLQPDPQRDPASGHGAAAPHATKPVAARAASNGSCEALVAVPRSPPEAPAGIAAR